MISKFRCHHGSGAWTHRGILPRFMLFHRVGGWRFSGFPIRKSGRLLSQPQIPGMIEVNANDTVTCAAADRPGDRSALQNASSAKKPIPDKKTRFRHAICDGAGQAWGY